MREWRNWQTRTFEGRVVTPYGFKSRFSHQKQETVYRLLFFCEFNKTGLEWERQAKLRFLRQTREHRRLCRCSLDFFKIHLLTLLFLQLFPIDKGIDIVNEECGEADYHRKIGDILDCS